MLSEKQMSPYLLITTIIFVSFILIPRSSALERTTTLFSPVTKDESTNLYSMLIYLKTPLQPSKLQLDLGSFIPWYDCAHNYRSSSYKGLPYNSSACRSLETGTGGGWNCYDPPGPSCINGSCGWFPENPVTQKAWFDEILTDTLALPKADGSKPGGQLGLVPEFVFSCAKKIFRGLTTGSSGLAALGRFNYSLPAQVSRAFSSPWIFALCLPSSAKNTGFVLFNSPGPYNFAPGLMDVSKSLTYTPLILGPRQSDSDLYYWHKSPEYYIGLTSFKVNRKVVPINQNLLAIGEVLGRGGTKISSSRPYSLLQTSIFKDLTDEFAAESARQNLTLVKPVEPFSLCYAAEKVPIDSRSGPTVPIIDLVLQNDNVIWRIYGSNSMVRIKNDNTDVWCLGFVDGGINARTSIVIGSHQLQNTLLQFDLERERLGFSSSLLSLGTTCADFTDIKST